MLSYFKKSKPSPLVGNPLEQHRLYTRLKWQVFLSATLGYGIYYVCRLSLNVVKPIVDSGILTESQLGLIGSALFLVMRLGSFAMVF